MACKCKHKNCTKKICFNKFGVKSFCGCPPDVGVLEVYGNSFFIPNGSETANAFNYTDFENVLMNNGIQRIFSIENSGSGNVEITNIVVPDGFTLISPLIFPFTLNSGDSINLIIESDSDSVDISSGNVVITSNAGNYSFYIFVNTYFEDTFNRSDRLLDNGWVILGWQIISEKAVNSPQDSANLLTDPSLEGSYTAGKNNNLTAVLAPIVSQSADSHSGAKAQQFQANAGGASLTWPSVAGLVNQWFVARVWRKRLSGAGTDNRWGVSQTGAIPSSNIAGKGLTSSIYERDELSLFSTSTNPISVTGTNEVSGSPFPVIVFDDGELTTITNSSVPALQDFGNKDIVLKLVPPNTFSDYVDSTLLGLMLRADSTVDPTSYIMVSIRRRQGNAFLLVSVWKKVGATVTALLTDQLITTVVSGAFLSVSMIGNNLSVYYNDVQVGTTQVISDALLINNTIHGMFSVGKNPIDRFIATSEDIPLSLTFAGTSFTFANLGHSYRTQNALNLLGLYDFTFTNQSLGGHNSFSNLIRLVTGSDIFIIDHANDSNAQWQNAALEAIIRKLWQANENTRIIIIGSPSWGTQNTSTNSLVHSPTNILAMQTIKDLVDHYGIDYVDYWQWCKDVVDASTYTLNQLVSNPPTIDTVHPSELGYTNMSQLELNYLPLGGTKKPLTMPSYLYDVGGLMSNNTATRRNGNANDGETGTWSAAGVAGRQSSTAGDTITFNNVTCSVIGAYRNPEANVTVEISVDGGAFYSFLLYQNGQSLAEGYGLHDIIIRVVSGTVRIDEFWAI